MTETRMDGVFRAGQAAVMPRTDSRIGQRVNPASEKKENGKLSAGNPDRMPNGDPVDLVLWGSERN